MTPQEKLLSENLALKNCIQEIGIEDSHIMECGWISGDDDPDPTCDYCQVFIRREKALNTPTTTALLDEVRVGVWEEAKVLVESCDWSKESPRNIWNMLDEKARSLRTYSQPKTEGE